MLCFALLTFRISEIINLKYCNCWDINGVLFIYIRLEVILWKHYNLKSNKTEVILFHAYTPRERLPMAGMLAQFYIVAVLTGRSMFHCFCQQRASRCGMLHGFSWGLVWVPKRCCRLCSRRRVMPSGYLFKIWGRRSVTERLVEYAGLFVHLVSSHEESPVLGLFQKFYDDVKIMRRRLIEMWDDHLMRSWNEKEKTQK